MPLPRPRMYATDAEKAEAYRKRKNQKAEQNERLAKVLKAIISEAESLGIIAVGNVPEEQKAEALRKALPAVTASQRNLIEASQ